MFFEVVILSIVEGITEFLPVSSTGHLILVSHLFNMKKEFYEVFDIAIQFGAILAVLFLYPHYFQSRIKNVMSKETVIIGISVFPILLVGYLLKDMIKDVLFSPVVIFWGLVVGGIGLIIIDKVIPKNQGSDQKETVTIKQAIMIGCWQCLALWPGMSRSAMSIMGGLVSGLNRVTAASFSFIIAVPVMVVVVGYDLISARSTFSLIEYAWIGFGMAISFGVAFFTMRWFLSMVQNQGLTFFGVYRILLGGLGLIFFI